MQEEARKREVPQHVKELRAIEWEIADLIKRLEALSAKVHDLTEGWGGDPVEDQSGTGL